MNDGHTGLSNQPVNQGESGHYKLVLSCLRGRFLTWERGVS
jgi:hypothetical protein